MQPGPYSMAPLQWNDYRIPSGVIFQITAAVQPLLMAAARFRNEAGGLMWSGQHQEPGMWSKQHQDRSARLCAVVTALQWSGSGQLINRSPGQQRRAHTGRQAAGGTYCCMATSGHLPSEVRLHVQVP